MICLREYGVNCSFKENNCWWLVINDLCKTAIEKNEIRLQSDGSPQRDFIHGDDVAVAIEVLIKSKKNNGNNIFHFASGETLTILELAYKVKTVFAQLYKKDIKIIFPDNTVLESPFVFQNEQKYCIDITKIRQLGFEPKISINEGISELFKYLESMHLHTSDNY